MSHSRSIRVKLVRLYVGLLSILFFCLGAYTYWGFRQFLVRELELSVERRAHQIAVIMVKRSPHRPPSDISEEIKDWYAPELNERAIRITDVSHQILYESDNVDLLGMPFSGVPPTQVGVGPSVYHWETTRDGKVICVVALDCLLPNGAVYTVEVGAPNTEMLTALNGLLIALAIAFPILIGLSILGSHFLLSRALRPVNEIVNTAERITYKNLSERLPVPDTGDEFERISEALNRMISRLDEAFRIASRFSADAAHELRTPLTIVHGELEVLVKNPELSIELAAYAGGILEELERLSKIVEGLLLVSRLEAGEAHLKLESIDLAKVAQSVSDQMNLLSENKSLTVKVDLQSNVIVEGDLARLKQVTVNLLDNAIKHTPPGGTIIIRVYTEQAKAILEISDTGIGISPAALPHIFNRFFRATEAKAARLEGSGLGLAIVQSITEAHGGSVSVECEKSPGTTMRVKLPLLSPDEIRIFGGK